MPVSLDCIDFIIGFWALSTRIRGLWRKSGDLRRFDARAQGRKGIIISIVKASIVASRRTCPPCAYCAHPFKRSCPLSVPTVHRWSAPTEMCSRLQRASEPLAVGMIREVRPLGGYGVLRFTAPHLYTCRACASILGHPIGAAVPGSDIASLCYYARDRSTLR